MNTSELISFNCGRKKKRERERARQPEVRFRADESKRHSKLETVAAEEIRGDATMCGGFISRSHNKDNLKTILIADYRSLKQLIN